MGVCYYNDQRYMYTACRELHKYECIMCERLCYSSCEYAIVLGKLYYIGIQAARINVYRMRIYILYNTKYTRSYKNRLRIRKIYILWCSTYTQCLWNRPLQKPCVGILLYNILEHNLVLVVLVRLTRTTSSAVKARNAIPASKRARRLHIQGIPLRIYPLRYLL